MSDQKVTSFLSFDVEALYGRATERHVEQLVWGEFSGGRFGISRISSVLNQHKIKGNFMIDFAMCMLYGEKVVRRIVDFLRSEGHQIHAHLHSEWLDRRWNINMDRGDPVFMSRTDSAFTERILQYTAYQMHAITGLDPTVFRAGGYLFNSETVAAIRNSGFRAASNFNADRHAKMWQLSGVALQNEPFYWPNQLLELPVDLSPEPLTLEWTKYLGYFDRAATRKRCKTFNLVCHSWSLLKREGEYFTSFAPSHEDGLHRICEHLRSHSNNAYYGDFLERPTTLETPLPSIPSYTVQADNYTTPPMHAWCNVCGHGFMAPPSTEVCPGCNSSTRHRQLHDCLKRLGNPFDGMSVFACAAHPVELNTALRRARNVLKFDVEPEGDALKLDVQQLDALRDGSFDSFLAVHVLDYVQDDERALREILRVLRPGGVAVLSIPLAAHADAGRPESNDGTYRRYSLQSAKELFEKFFRVSTGLGTDPLLGESLQFFFLNKPSLESAS